MILEQFTVPPLGCNCVILGDEESNTAIVVDPGGDAPGIVARLAARGLRCVAIVHTHTHFDHVGGTRGVQEATHAPTMIHEGDLFLYDGLQMQVDAFRMPYKVDAPVAIDKFLVDGDSVRAGAIEVEVIHTPGHTPGSLCFSIDGDRPLVIAGDTLFRQSIGRTDLWGGNTTQILHSITHRLLALPDETVVICGHGPNTTIGEERAFNPFL